MLSAKNSKLSPAKDDKTEWIKALETIEKKYGKGAIMTFDNNKQDHTVEVVPTGSLSLDFALGIGGLPKGRIVEIFGPESSGKTTMAIKALVECQRLGGNVAFIDAEHALDLNYLRKLGGTIDPQQFSISQPSSGEEALEIAHILIKSNCVDMIIVDSVAALTPQAEIDGAIGDAHIGLQSRLMSQALRKLASSAQKTNTIIIFINQIRMRIGVFFGNPETTTGGNALKFYASVRLDIRKGSAIKDERDNQIGHVIKIKVVKNKMAAPHRTAEFDFIYSEPASRERELFQMALNNQIITCSGAWYYYGESKIAQGKEKVISLLKENHGFNSEVLKKIEALL